MLKGIISRVNLSEVPAVASLIREVAPLAFEGLGTPEQMYRWLDQHAGESVISARVTNPNCVVVAAKSDRGEIVGTAYLELSADEASLSGYLGGLYCRVRDRGLGTAIIRVLVQLAGSLGVSVVSLSVAAKNTRMLHVARRLGFMETSRYVDKEFFPTDVFVVLAMKMPPAE